MLRLLDSPVLCLPTHPKAMQLFTPIPGTQSSPTCPQGNRDNIDSMAGGSQKVLVQVLKLIDAHDLYGRCAAWWWQGAGVENLLTHCI